ncbi:MAG: hypothetical protein NVS3B5_16720 [Sphingomicrobium sp.]
MFMDIVFALSSPTTVFLLLTGVELLSIAIAARLELREFSDALTLGATGLVLATYPPQLTAWTGLHAAPPAGFLHPQACTWTKDEFQARSDRGSPFINWPCARRLERDGDRLSVFITKRVAYIVPRRVFADASAFDAF